MSDERFFESLASAIQNVLRQSDAEQASTHYSIPELDQIARSKAAASRMPSGLGIIRQHDAEFDLGVFLKRVGDMFLAYHAAADNGDLKPARRFITEEAWAEHARAAHKVGRRADGMRAFHIKAIHPMSTKHEYGLDKVRVLISAQVTNDGDSPLCEYWELIRKRGALTRPGLDLRHCPHCGAPIDGDDPTRCAFCGERLADPAYDWVASSIFAQ